MATTSTHATSTQAAWPAIPLADWDDTRATFHLWTQIVGKIRMVRTPLVNHWWNVPLYVTARGLTTSPIPDPDGREFEMEFAFDTHRLEIEVTDGRRAAVALEPRSVADFYDEVMRRLADLGLATEIWTVPVEIPGDVVPFDEDHEHASYDGDAVRRFWLALVESHRVMTEFRARFLGKASPVHLFWGGLDLAVTRFSGRPAPLHPGGAPHCGPFVMHEAYSHEVSSCGYWPGAGAEGAFYSYAYPEPPGYRDRSAGPDGAFFDTDLGEFLLPYERVRTAADPDATLLAFLQATYDAAADCAGWDRAALERPAPG
jgi:hypothetical protein